MDLRQHRHYARPAQVDGAFHRLVARARHLRCRLLPPAAAPVPRHAQSGPRRPQDAQGQLGPGRPHRARQRAGDRRPRLALRRAHRAARAAGMGVQDHRLRTRPARCASAPRPLAGEGSADAGELDRALGRDAGPLRDDQGAQGPRADRSVHHAPRHALRRELHRHRAGPPFGQSRGADQSRRAGVHRRMPSSRHHHRRARDAGEEGLRYGFARAPSRDRGRRASRVHREFHPHGIWHRRDLRLPGARPARSRICAEPGLACDPRRAPGRRRSSAIQNSRRGLYRRRYDDQLSHSRSASTSPPPSRRSPTSWLRNA